jgi:hypothetical protein
MTDPQSMDELFWGMDREDVNDWAECLTMVAKVKDLNDDKLFKIAKLNLHSRIKKWFKKLNSPLANWTILRNEIFQKFGDVDAEKFTSN